MSDDYITNLVGDLYLFRDLKCHVIARRIGPIFEKPHLIRLTTLSQPQKCPACRAMQAIENLTKKPHGAKSWRTTPRGGKRTHARYLLAHLHATLAEARRKGAESHRGGGR